MVALDVVVNKLCKLDGTRLIPLIYAVVILICNSIYSASLLPRLNVSHMLVERCGKHVIVELEGTHLVFSGGYRKGLCVGASRRAEKHCKAAGIT